MHRLKAEPPLKPTARPGLRAVKIDVNANPRAIPAGQDRADLLRLHSARDNLVAAQRPIISENHGGTPQRHIGITTEANFEISQGEKFSPAAINALAGHHL